jgi:hypothetical protein
VNVIHAGEVHAQLADENVEHCRDNVDHDEDTEDEDWESIGASALRARCTTYGERLAIEILNNEEIESHMVRPPQKKLRPNNGAQNNE